MAAPLQSLIVPRGPRSAPPELWADEDEAGWLLKLAKAKVAAAEAEEAEWRAAIARAREAEANLTSAVHAIVPAAEPEPDWDALLAQARMRSPVAVSDKGAQPARPPKPRRPAQSGTFPAAIVPPELAGSVRRLPPPLPRRAPPPVPSRATATSASNDPFAPLVPFAPPRRDAQVVSWPPVALKAG